MFYHFACAQGSVNQDSLKITELEKQIDSIITDAIKQEAFPGCVVFASSQDSLVYFKSYGHYTYDSLQKVKKNSIYDLASITKVAGATLALMKLYEDSLLHLDDPIKKYIQGLGGQVGQVTIREALSHQGGLYPWIPYYQRIKKKNGEFKKKYIADVQSRAYPFKLSDNHYLHSNFYQKVKRLIRNSEVKKNPDYKYSGLFFYLVPEIVKNLSGIEYEEYLQVNFYRPLQAETIGFRPLSRFKKELIVPTEIDSFFRMEPIHGRVHDEGAIMMKGISGNAGLFGSAIDLAKLMSMLLQEGSYDSLALLRSQTIDLFNTVQYPNLRNRRGLGFDKPLLEYDAAKSSVAKSASRRSFGHTGYTGTLAWADPENDLVYIFLSNRVYPSRKNTKIYQLNVRPTIHQIIYDFLDGYNAENPSTVEKTR